MLRWWTIGRATGAGAASGLAALILWPVYAAVQDPALPLYVAALALAAFCGLSILWITAADLLFHRRRGERLLPLRVFDTLFALLLFIPSAMTLAALLA